jgi:hypothetical protein
MENGIEFDLGDAPFVRGTVQMLSMLPREAQEDPFRPPAKAVEVECLHCGARYSSDEMVWEERGGQKLWWCKKWSCNGAGFKFDLQPRDFFTGPPGVVVDGGKKWRRRR